MRNMGPPGSGQEAGDRASADGQPEGESDRPGELFRADRAVARLPAEAVARPDHAPAANAAARPQRRPDAGPVVAPAFAVQVRRPPELAGRDHERRVEQAALPQVSEEGR